ncbi:MAG: phosphopantothenoylcysteine decarboxylase [Verrucomicrobiota bacterium]
MTSNNQARRILITAGPAVTQIDAVRQITNHSTGGLGSQLTEQLSLQQHSVTLLRSRYCTAPPPAGKHHHVSFTCGKSLLDEIRRLSRKQPFDAVWHAAAVGDFAIEKITDEEGNLLDHQQKIQSRSGKIQLHLIPAPKLLEEFRSLFPGSCIVGWKYETDGTREDVYGKARQQIARCSIDACVANGLPFHNQFHICQPGKTVTIAHDAGDLARVLLSLIH